MGHKHGKVVKLEPAAPAAPAHDAWDEIELRHRLVAEEAVRAQVRELETLDRAHELELVMRYEQRNIDLAKAASEHQAALELVREQHRLALERSAADAEIRALELERATAAALANDAVVRAHSTARFVQAVAAVVAAVYVAALAVVVAVSDQQLPWRASIAPVFLGAAIVLAAMDGAGGRRWLRHAAVSLGVGIAFTVAPFVGGG